MSAGSINAAIAAFALLFHRDARTARPRSSSDDREQAAPSAGRAEPGGGGAPARSRARPEVQGRASRRLRRPARLRGREPEGIRHRQPAHDASGRAGQRAAGSLCDALAATARTVARLAVGVAAAGLAVSSARTPSIRCRLASSDASSVRRRRRREFHQARVAAHFLRHSFATHLLEQNVDIRVIQVLLGHAKLETTALYTRVAVNTIRDVTSPLDRLGVNLGEATAARLTVARPRPRRSPTSAPHGSAWCRANAVATSASAR